MTVSLTKEKGDFGPIVHLTFCKIIESHVLKFTAKGSPLHSSPS